MASVIKFDTWQNTNGEVIADTAGGARLPLSGNAIINGDFGVNQRGFSSTTSSGEYIFDRFRTNFSGGTSTFSAQSFTPADIEALGYGDATSYLRIANSSYTGASAYCLLQQYVEDVRTLSDQTVTVSFWAKSGSSSSITIELEQYFGSGGSTSVNNLGSVKIATTTSWARYSATITLPSISGKTVGANSSLRVTMWFEAGTDFNTRSNSLGIQNDTFDIWGVQLEAGPVATPFRLAGGGSKAAELALCQRYYQTMSGNNQAVGMGHATSTANIRFQMPSNQIMRSVPSVSGTDLVALGTNTVASYAISLVSPNDSNSFGIFGNATSSSLTSSAVYLLRFDTLNFDAEL